MRRESTKPPSTDRVGEIRWLLTGGDRRSIADSNRVRAMLDETPALLADVAALTADEDRLVVQRAIDLLEKVAHADPERVEPYKLVFIGPLAESEMWEVRLQVVRALPLFRWTPTQMKRVEQILRENVAFPQTFVRAWALDSLATLATKRPPLMQVVRKHLSEFERSSSKALQARARKIRERLAGG